MILVFYEFNRFLQQIKIKMAWKLQFDSIGQPLIVMAAGNAIFFWFTFVEADRTLLSILWQVAYQLLALGILWAKCYPRYNGETGELA
jgi:hypothetical protein